ncbi:MAG: DUF4330 domain-containing protein [Clostridiales bacterium]|jgi:hypothetical protein|nr:DUF4330 domain-containing protein [Clostridiales bacterium]
MIDGKFRIFGKVSLADILFVAIAAAVIAAGVKFSAPRSAAAKIGGVKIRYTAEMYKKTTDFKENVKIGDVVYDSLKGFEIGTIVEVYALPYMEDVPDARKGVIRRTPIDGLEYVYAVIEANAQVTSGSTAIGEYEVMVGKEAFIKSKSFASSAYFIKLERM